MRAFELLSEMAALKNTTDDKYLIYVNDVLLANTMPIEMGEKRELGTLIPNPGQQVNSRSDTITGTVDGEPAEFKANQIFKSPEMKAWESGKEAGEKISNKGEVIEGILGAATYARLLKRSGSDITPNDVFSAIKSLNKNGTVSKTVKEMEGNISDKIQLTVKLKINAFDDYKNIDKIKSLMAGEIQSIVDYTNDAVRKYGNFFAKNGRPDVVEIVSDGVTNETETKTDVLMYYNNPEGKRVVQHFDLSVKSGDVSQVGQVGGGGQADSLETRFEFVKGLWERFGVDISPIKNAFVGSEDIVEAYGKAYYHAAKTFAEKLVGANEDSETIVLKKFVEGIKYFATLGEDRVKLVDFSPSGYYVLDFKKLDRLYNNKEINLTAKYTVGPKSGLPLVHIVDTVTGKRFLQVRMYRTDAGYVRNYVEKGPILKKVTQVRSKKRTPSK